SAPGTNRHRARRRAHPDRRRGEPQRTVGQAEIFDPASGAFSVVGSSVVARADHTATLLGDARVLIAGGRQYTTRLDSTELFDPATGTFQAVPATLRQPRAGHSATVLADGTLLIAGG